MSMRQQLIPLEADLDENVLTFRVGEHIDGLIEDLNVIVDDFIWAWVEFKPYLDRLY